MHTIQDRPGGSRRTSLRALALAAGLLAAIACSAIAEPRGDLSPVELYARTSMSVVSVRVYVEDLFGQVGQTTGSGFLYGEAGYIVTNRHVVQGARRIVVVFWDGFETAAQIVGADPQSDLAVLSVEERPEGLVPLRLGNSEAMQVGQEVAAIGNPFGLGGSMTMGIISAVGRTIPSGATPFAIPLALQTDAAVNPGNSGGPLLNLRGEVVGVTAQIATGGEAGSAGVGFAIPARVVSKVVPTLIEEGRYEWPWLGISGDSVDLSIQEANELERQRGAYIHSVVEGSPADAAGLRGSSDTTAIGGVPVPVGGDVVLQVDGVDVASFDDLLTELAFKRPGDRVSLSVLREGAILVVPVTLGARPDEL